MSAVIPAITADKASRRERVIAWLAGEDWIDRAIQWASGLAAVAMFAYGVALSYSVLHSVAVAAKLPAWAAAMWPLGFEAFMASAALNALAEQRRRRGEESVWKRVPWYPWILTALTAGVSIALNWFHPAIPLDPPPSWLVSLVYGLPPLVAVFAWHLFLQRVAHRRKTTTSEAGGRRPRQVGQEREAGPTTTPSAPAASSPRVRPHGVGEAPAPGGSKPAAAPARSGVAPPTPERVTKNRSAERTRLIREQLATDPNRSANKIKPVLRSAGVGVGESGAFYALVEQLRSEMKQESNGAPERIEVLS